MRSLTVVVPGEPVAKGRPRVNTRTGTAYTPTKTKDAELAIAQTVMAERVGADMPWDGPIKLTLIFLAGSKKGDLDNYIKLVSDALNGVAFVDDDQVIEIYARVHRGVHIIDPETIITIKQIEETSP